MTARRPDKPGRPADHHAGRPQRRGSESARRSGGGRSAEDQRRRMLTMGIVGVIGLFVVLAVAVAVMNGIGGAGGSSGPIPPIGAGAAGATATPRPSVGPTATTNVGAKPAGCPSAAPAALPAGETRTVTLTTKLGAIAVQVKADLSPLAAGNFVALAECGFYNGVVFHRIVPGFVIQGGDRAGTGAGKEPGYTIKDEPVTTAYKRGTVAMARTPVPNSQGSQFFVVLDDRNSLGQTNTYAIFGTVTSGMDIVDAIAKMPNTGSGNTAMDPVAMDTVTVNKP